MKISKNEFYFIKTGGNKRTKTETKQDIKINVNAKSINTSNEKSFPLLNFLKFISRII